MNIYNFREEIKRYTRQTCVGGFCAATLAITPFELKNHHQPKDDLAHQTEYMLQFGQQSIYNISGSYQFDFNGYYHNIVKSS